ncbi:hypothetical protein LguiB_023129 [Lonicera macranthoides]
MQTRKDKLSNLKNLENLDLSFNHLRDTTTNHDLTRFPSYDEYSSGYNPPHSQSYRRIDDQLQSLNLGQHYYGGHRYDYDYDSRRHSISGGEIFSYGFGTGYGGSAQDYASNGGSNNTIAARGGYYGSDRGTYHDGSSSSNDYRGFGYYHHDGQPNFPDYGSSSHSSHPYESSSHSSYPYPTSANSQPPLYPHSSSLEFLSKILVLDKLETLDLSSNWLSSSPTKKELSVLDKSETLDLGGNSLNGSLTERINPQSWLLDHLRLALIMRRRFNLIWIRFIPSGRNMDLSGTTTLAGSRPAFITTCSLNSFNKISFYRLNLATSFCSLRVTTWAADSIKLTSHDSAKSGIQIGNHTSEQFGGLASFRNLEILDLTGNSFVGSISSSISALSSLKALSLAGNGLGGSLPTQGFCELKELEELDLSENMFVGTLPPFLSNLTSLRLLDLSRNQFSGRVPPSLITDFTALEFIDRSYNNLEGVFSFISSSAKIRILNLAHNMMEGSFSNSSLQIFTKLEYLNLRNNSFSGTFHLPPDRQSNLHFIDLSDNHFTGRMQANLGQILPVILSSNLSSLKQLMVLVISHNSFSGTIPTSIYNMTALASLSMQNNFFEGNFPTDLQRVNEIQLLDVSHNSLSGSLSSFSSFGNLQHLHLQTNRFTGPIPHSFSSSNLSGLVTLDISDNKLSGHLPSFIGEFPDLRVISVRGNDFSGFIPNKLCQLATISLMDLSNNSFSGSLPHCFHNITFFAKTEASVPVGRFPPKFSPYIYALFVDDSYTNIILGNIKSDMLYFEYNIQDEVEFGTKHSRHTYVGGRILNYMSGLDLSLNNLTGEIPPEFGMLREIRALNLSHNKLTGPIPKAFSNLTQIESLDLSFNRLSGQIPSQLIDLNFLAVFSVAHNNLSGRLPERKKQFATFEGDSYEGNQFQCGLPVVEENCLTGGFNNSPPTPQDESEEEEEKWYEVDRVFFSASFVAAYSVFFFGYGALLYINPNWRRRWFNLIEECMYSCYYFLYDSLHKLSALVHA